VDRGTGAGQGMSGGSLPLRAYPGDLVELACEKCGRRGQYRKRTLVERSGPEIRLLDLLEEIAQCPRARNTYDACGAHFVGLV
jgi:hypothetical protein